MINTITTGFGGRRMINRRQLIQGAGAVAAVTALPGAVQAAIPDPAHEEMLRKFDRLIEWHHQSTPKWIDPVKDITRRMARMGVFDPKCVMESPATIAFTEDKQIWNPATKDFYPRSWLGSTGTKVCVTACSRWFRTAWTDFDNIDTEYLARELVGEIWQKREDDSALFRRLHGFEMPITYFSYVPVVVAQTIDINTFTPYLGFKSRYGALAGNFRIMTIEEDRAHHLEEMKRFYA